MYVNYISKIKMWKLQEEKLLDWSHKNFKILHVKLPETKLNDRLGGIHAFHVTQKGSFLKRAQHPNRKLGIGDGQFIKT